MIEVSKAGDFVKKVEEGIESIIAGGHTDPAVSEENHPSRSQYVVTTDNLAVPEVHTGKAAHKEKERAEACTSGENKDAGDGTGSPAEEGKRPTIQFDTVAVPEIHIPHKK